jgi:DNA-binding response OmpR family regulator
VRTLRGAGYLFPVILVTARETLKDKQTGFLAGADDYMVKPIDMGEMMLRVNALLRRARIASDHTLTIGDVTLDYDALSVARGEFVTTLPQKEFYLLFKLLSYPGVIFTRMQLMDDIWGMETETDDRTVDVHIKRLRDKFGGWPDFEIVTIRGLGYKAQRGAGR